MINISFLQRIAHMRSQMHSSKCHGNSCVRLGENLCKRNFSFSLPSKPSTSWMVPSYSLLGARCNSFELHINAAAVKRRIVNNFQFLSRFSFVVPPPPRLNLFHRLMNVFACVLARGKRHEDDSSMQKDFLESFPVFLFLFHSFLHSERPQTGLRILQRNRNLLTRSAHNIFDSSAVFSFNVYDQVGSWWNTLGMFPYCRWLLRTCVNLNNICVERYYLVHFEEAWLIFVFYCSLSVTIMFTQLNWRRRCSRNFFYRRPVS